MNDENNPGLAWSRAQREHFQYFVLEFEIFSLSDATRIHHWTACHPEYLRKSHTFPEKNSDFQKKSPKISDFQKKNPGFKKKSPVGEFPLPCIKKKSPVQTGKKKHWFEPTVSLSAKTMHNGGVYRPVGAVSKSSHLGV